MKEFQHEYIAKFIDEFYKPHQGSLGELEEKARAEGLSDMIKIALHTAISL